MRVLHCNMFATYVCLSDKKEKKEKKEEKKRARVRSNVPSADIVT